jgi:hypothetical protein
MNYGQGSIGFVSKSPNGPPFPVNAARDGTSIDPGDGAIVLGQAYGQAGDPGAITDNREIPILNAAEFTLGDASGVAWLVVNTAFGVVAMGIDVNNTNIARFVADQSQQMTQVVAALKISLLCGTGVILLDTPPPVSASAGDVLLRNTAGGATDSRIETITGASGSFTTVDLKTVTVVRGVITAIV